jgi:hypothetical protein
MPDPADELLTVDEALAEYPYSRRTIERWISIGLLQTVQPYVRTQRYVLRSQLEQQAKSSA